MLQVDVERHADLVSALADEAERQGRASASLARWILRQVLCEGRPPRAVRAKLQATRKAVDKQKTE
jgi:hypothetical protein